MVIHKYTSFFYPKSLDLHNDSEVRTAFTFVLCSLIASLIFFIYGVNYYYILNSEYILCSNLTWSFLLIFNVFIFKRGLSLSLVSNITTALVFIGILNVSLCLGREKTMGIYFLNVIPLSVGLFLSKRYLALWSTLCLLAYPFLKYVGPKYFDHLDIPLTPEFNNFLWESSYYVNTILIILFISIYMMSLKNSLKSIEKKSDSAHGLLRVLTHDIKTPLTVVYNASKFLQKDDLSVEQRLKWAKKIEFGSSMINSIADQVKQIEALESGKSRVTISSVPLKHIINDIEQLFSEKLENKKLDLKLNGNFNFMIEAEPITLTHQVFSNIISNAIKFSQENGSITIESKELGPNVIVSIKDSGIGIPDKLLKKLFSKTSPTSRQGTAGEKGTGFGMPLVKEYMALYDGTVTVQSKDIAISPNDHGTEITLEFIKTI